MQVFGVDIGGTGIKGAPVDIDEGTLAAPRIRIPTPQPSLPGAIAKTVADVVDHFGWTGPVGATFPAVLKDGIAKTAANVDPSWVDTDLAATLGAVLPGGVTVINDADAAGIAEMTFGAGRDVGGVVLMTTFGTGIGTALFLHGQLLANTEFGHLEIGGSAAEASASEAAREREDLSWEKWAKRVSRYLSALEALLWPDLIIIGGGASRKADRFLDRLEIRTKVVPAQLQNNAGIVGAALFAAGDQARPKAPARAPRRRPPATRPPGGRRP
ncbi:MULTISPECIES: polyphosphate--glucose phosphotransferase [unclassified Frankia]|uniref:polyphosphate--glucose phosphotransferase n=1 Tax=unclassified Frankia TaxID=2632575 RepID=UPI002AD50250|nr:MULTISPECIES: ROK family protein [unclassified Frankia]